MQREQIEQLLWFITMILPSFWQQKSFFQCQCVHIWIRINNHNTKSVQCKREIGSGTDCSCVRRCCWSRPLRRGSGGFRHTAGGGGCTPLRRGRATLPGSTAEGPHLEEEQRGNCQRTSHMEGFGMEQWLLRCLCYLHHNSFMYWDIMHVSHQIKLAINEVRSMV